jgi:hypothetical protein
MDVAVPEALESMTIKHTTIYQLER